jgi:hypothetical protein
MVSGYALDGLKVQYYVVGDLVIFTGHLYTPDYTYVEHYNYSKLKVGVVLGIINNNYYNDVLYRVYWLATGRITSTVSGHLKLAYTKK